MLIIEDNSVYEIDEECMRKRKVPRECKTLEKVKKELPLEKRAEATTDRMRD